MTTTEDATPIRISGPAGLLAVVPSMLGFHPTNSLVLMCLSGGRRRVGPVARVDLAKGHDHAMAEHLTNHARNHADEVVVISYQNSRRRPPMLDDLLAALARAGIDVMDAMVVRGGRVRPALNAAMERVHPGVPVPGSDDPQVRELAVAGALAGRTVLSDRNQLRRSIAGPRGARLARAQRHVDEAAAGRLPTIGDSTPSDGPAARGPSAEPALQTAGQHEHVLRVGPYPEDVDDLLEQAFLQFGATGEITVEVATALAVMLTDDLIRDSVLIRAVAEIDQPWLPMLIASATWTPNYLAPPLCSVLAMVAYRHGDGALAQIAVDRCLAAEPRHSLAQLMIAIMSAGMRPEELERIARAGLAPAAPDWEAAAWDAAWDAVCEDGASAEGGHDEGAYEPAHCIDADCVDDGCRHNACNHLAGDGLDDSWDDDDDLDWADRGYGDPDSTVVAPFWKEKP